MINTDNKEVIDIKIINSEEEPELLFIYEKHVFAVVNFQDLMGLYTHIEDAILEVIFPDKHDRYLIEDEIEHLRESDELSFSFSMYRVNPPEPLVLFRPALA